MQALPIRVQLAAWMGDPDSPCACMPSYTRSNRLQITLQGLWPCPPKPSSNPGESGKVRWGGLAPVSDPVAEPEPPPTSYVGLRKQQVLVFTQYMQRFSDIPGNFRLPSFLILGSLLDPGHGYNESSVPSPIGPGGKRKIPGISWLISW